MPKNFVRNKLFHHIEATDLNEWESDEIVEKLDELPGAYLEETLNLIPAIWPVSHALALSFLNHVKKSSQCLAPDQLKEWVGSILAVYEKEGLHSANQYMDDVEKNFACKIRGEGGLSLEAVRNRLLIYLKGLSGRSIDILPANKAYSDSLTIFLPSELALFKTDNENFFTFKFTVTFQWAYMFYGTYSVPNRAAEVYAKQIIKKHTKKWEKNGSTLANFLQLYPEPKRALLLYQIAESVRIWTRLATKYPGLMRDAVQYFTLFYRDHTSLHGNKLLPPVQNLLNLSFHNGMEDSDTISLNRTGSLLSSLTEDKTTSFDSLKVADKLYTLFSDHPGEIINPYFTILFGRLQPDKYAGKCRQRRDILKQKFHDVLTKKLSLQTIQHNHDDSAEKNFSQPQTQKEPSTRIMLPLQVNDSDDTEEKDRRQQNISMLLEGPEYELPDDLRQIVSEIRNEYQSIPDDFISSMSGVAGAFPAKQAHSKQPTDENSLHGTLVYDEWDYRRSGFRKNWCNLLTKELVPVRGTFVDHTLNNYRGLLIQLRHRFELMRTQEHIAKRQRDGDDFDLDAVTDALADVKADLPPSEKLFLRLIRNKRNIATIFLVDMSSSTEGWVSTAIKESLVLMCEALEVLGDRYAIYGFSGMRRTRSELHNIKHLHEKYDDRIKGKIAAITPKDYTRMGPPIRHATKILSETEAKIRLLITLSDGKPEDYDDYKGEYAIEDTRHALIEAKHGGIHPFCITIDKQAHNYIAHMYGAVNYIFINDVKKLPARMPEIYRTLTT